ncbi:MAG: CDP-alcohol phosphatidyltransferase family protein [Thermoleophilaceae bacterium]
MLATVPAEDGGPAAALPWEGSTLLRRLLRQLEDLEILQVSVVTRPGWERVLEPAVAGLGPAVRLQASPGVSEDLRTVAEIARDGTGPIVVVHGEIVTHREALAGLLVGPRMVTGVLSRHGGVPAHLAPRTRSTSGRVMSASSPYHATGRPNTSLLGVLKVGERDRPALVEVAERLASLVEPPLPPGWEEELERKLSRWRTSLADDGAGHGSAERRRERDGGGAFTEARELEQAPAGDELAEAPEPDEPEDATADLVLSPEGEAEATQRLTILREDAVSLLLVGLVRADVHVANSFLRALFWSRPQSRAAAQDTADQMEGYDEDRVLLDSAVKASDGFFTTFFVSPYSRYIARWAARRGLTPNQVTTVSMAIGVLAAAAFATGSRPGLVAGAVLLQAAFTADCVDGQLARYTRTFSKFGAWLDSIFDRAKEYVVFAGLAIGASRGFGEDVWVLAVAAMSLQTARHMADFSFGATRHEASAAEWRPPIEVPGDGVALRRSVSAALPTSPPGLDGDSGPAAVTAPTGPSPSPPLHAEPAADVPAKSAPRLARRIVTGVARRAIAVSRALERRPWTRWFKKILVFPIGERFAVISVAAAATTPRTTFIIVLVWGTVATLYTLVGRSIRSLSA